MPQATLLDFFKAQSPGPFAAVVLPQELSCPEAPHGVLVEEVKVIGNGDLEQELSPAQLNQSVEQHAPASSTKEEPNLVLEEATETNGLTPEPDLPSLTIVAVQTQYIPALKRLTGNLLPIRYPDKFYDGTVNETIPAAFSRVALIDGKPVGWIRCRLDPFPEPTVPPPKTKLIHNRIYIQALCLLAPYRGLGIATSLLRAVSVEPLTRDHGILHVYAHVWEENGEALEWYERRGFKRIVKVEQYYRKLRPGGAWVVQRDL